VKVMVQFHPVQLRASSGVRDAGWVVEMADNKRKRRIVSQLFPSKAEAKAEADRLNAIEPMKPEK
jgi:hypothetical protein